MQARIDDSNVARLKDRIREIYAEHHRSKIITKMELESLENLIDSYVASGGNGFVACTVEPEMFTWTIVDDDYYVRERKEQLTKDFINEV